MVIDTKFIGKTYPMVSFELGREKLRDFLIATKADQEKFSEFAPPTFPVVFMHEILAQILFDDELKLNLAKLVHGEQEFIYHKPINLGDIISSNASIEKIFSKGPHDFVVVKSISLNHLKEKVCESSWTFVVRGGNDSDFSLQEKLMMKLASIFVPSPKDIQLQKKAYELLAHRAGYHINHGAAKQDLVYYEHTGNDSLMQVYIDKYMPQVYAGASGDFNVIHLDENFGKNSGLGGYILHGMATMAMGANFACNSLDPKAIKRFVARFSGMVKPKDTLTYKGHFDQDSKSFKFNAVNQKNQEVLSSGLIELS